MKRWTVLSGRIGTVLLAIGLALLLVSLIPPMGGQTSSSMGSFYFYPRLWQTLFEQLLTPQQNLHFSVTANGTLSVYLFEIGSVVILDWIREHHSEALDYLSNVTYFEEFLQANPASSIWQREIHSEKIEQDYTPTKVTNVTLVLSNPNPDFVSINYSTEVETLIAPTGKVKTLAIWIIPLGFVLALPWLIDLWRAKTRR